MKDDTDISEDSFPFPIEDPAWEALQDQIISQLNAGETVTLSGLVRQYPQYRGKLKCLLPRLEAGLHKNPFSTHSKQNLPLIELPPWQAGEIILEDFTVKKELGKGGFGHVYLVRNNLTNHPYAVKRIAFHDASNKIMTRVSHGTRFFQTRKRFLQELMEWIDLPEHMNLVTCYFFRSYKDEILIFAAYRGEQTTRLTGGPDFIPRKRFI